jgi:cystathionine beta-lyase
MKSKPHPLTQAVHSGKEKPERNIGVNTPIFTDSAFKYRETEVVMYPRYFNTPNNVAAAAKIASLENAESALIFSSGMAAISSALSTFLSSGDHVIFSKELYGGTYNLITREFPKNGINYSMVESNDIEAFQRCLRKETKVIYLESPSNPLLTITDIHSVAELAHQHNLITMIDNTFASPVNQNPIDLGIDVVLHSGTKYLGGHSDLCFGVAAATKSLIKGMHQTALNLGGSLNAADLYMVERSLKTLILRVRQQTANAKELALRLHRHDMIRQVYYPGLPEHPGHEVAKKQMQDFGAMLAFNLKTDDAEDVNHFLNKLQLITPAISLGGVETTICSPVETSHAKMPEHERLKLGITWFTLRLSVGIEYVEDLYHDLDTALESIRKSTVLKK